MGMWKKMGPTFWISIMLEIMILQKNFYIIFWSKTILTKTYEKMWGHWAFAPMLCAWRVSLTPSSSLLKYSFLDGDIHVSKLLQAGHFWLVGWMLSPMIRWCWALQKCAVPSAPVEGPSGNSSATAWSMKTETWAVFTQADGGSPARVAAGKGGQLTDRLCASASPWGSPC